MSHGPRGPRVCIRGVESGSPDPSPRGESMGETAEGSPSGVCGKGMVALNLSILVILLLGIGWIGSFIQGERSRAARVHRGMDSISLYPKKVPVPPNLPHIYVPPPLPVQPPPRTTTTVTAEPSTTVTAEPPTTSSPLTTVPPPAPAVPAAAPAPPVQIKINNYYRGSAGQQPQRDSPSAKAKPQEEKSQKEAEPLPTYGWSNGGYLAVYHEGTAYCAGVKAPAKNGSHVALHPCDTPHSEPSKEKKLLQWQFNGQSYGMQKVRVGKLQLKTTGAIHFCLDVTNHTFRKDTWIQIWECGTGDVDQDMRLFQLASGAWRFQWLHGESHWEEGGPWYLDIKDQDNILDGRPLEPHHLVANRGQFAN